MGGIGNGIGGDAFSHSRKSREMKFKTPLDHSAERFRASHDYIKQRKAEDEARFKAIEQIIHKEYLEKRQNSAEKVIQVGDDDTIRKMKEQEQKEKEEQENEREDQN